MKIAVFYNLPFSGAKRQVMEHVKGLRSRGHLVDVYTIDENDDIFDPGAFANHEYRYVFNTKALNIPVLKRIKKDLDIFYKLKQLHKTIGYDIDSRNYDIALIHTDFLTQAPFILRFLKTKNVYFCLEPLRMVHEYALRTPDNIGFFNKTYENVNRYIRKKIDRGNARSADFALAISLFGRELMIQAFDIYPQISYLGVDTDIFRPLGLDKKNQILFIGQKVSINGYQCALKAMEYIPKDIRPELKVLSIKRDAQERLSDGELIKIYSESILTLSLSTFDTFGLVPLESMACGTPVIAFNVAGYRETMGGKDIGFLTGFDPREIAEKIILFRKNPDLSEKMGQNGRKWVEKYWTWKEQIKKLEQQLMQYMEGERNN